MTRTPLEDFEHLWTRERDPDLLEAVLHLPHIHYPELAVANLADQVRHLIDLARLRLLNSPNEHTRLLRLNHFLFDEMGFRGDQVDYYDPRNSYLNDVLDRRTGIPISLSVLYMIVARRTGLEISGIGLPAHFVVRHEAADPAHRVYVDPYHRQVLPNRAACRRLISRITGGDAHLDDDAFAPVSTRDIILRMLANLKGAYLRRDDFPRTVSVLDRILILVPKEAQQWRDRGLLHHQLGNLGQASFDLSRYLWLAGETDEHAGKVQETLEALQETRARLN